LKGRAIPLSARLMAVADVFDALTTPRAYKTAWPVQRAVDYIVERSGRQFDPDVVAALLASRDSFEAVASRWQD
jgi:putative two-component system response regulator